MIVPNALKKWFVLHFVIDIIVALPLMLMPVTVLEVLGWENIDPIATRLFAAALFAIGIKSYIGRNLNIAVYDAMLNLKIIWSTFAIVGLVSSTMQGIEQDNPFVWLGILVFLLFNILWIYWKLRLQKLNNKRSIP